MRKVKLYLTLILLLLISFYTINKTNIEMKQKNPIMEQIKNSKNKYNIKPVNAIIKDNTIIPGVQGIEIDYEKSYKEMKEYGNYNETLTVMKEVSPEISVNNNYDKYIISGNKSKKEVALIFKINKDTNPNNIIDIIKDKNIKATFFIDGTYLEENINVIRRITNQELEILSYNNEFESSFIKTSISYLETISKNTPKYCYTEEENKTILRTCKKIGKHTIIPNLVIKNNLYKNIKSNLSNGMMITIEINNYTEEELSIAIDYIKSKGYVIVPLNKLLRED